MEFKFVTHKLLFDNEEIGIKFSNKLSENEIIEFIKHTLELDENIEVRFREFSRSSSLKPICHLSYLLDTNNLKFFVEIYDSEC